MCCIYASWIPMFFPIRQQTIFGPRPPKQHTKRAWNLLCVPRRKPVVWANNHIMMISTESLRWPSHIPAVAFRSQTNYMLNQHMAICIGDAITWATPVMNRSILFYILLFCYLGALVFYCQEYCHWVQAELVICRLLYSLNAMGA